MEFHNMLIIAMGHADGRNCTVAFKPDTIGEAGQANSLALSYLGQGKYRQSLGYIG